MKKGILSLIVVSFFACTEQPKTGDNTVTKADTLISPALNRSIMADVSLDSLVVTADPKGHITVGNQVVEFDKLESKLVDTLQFMKKNYGKLPDTILYRSKGDVMMGTRGAIKDAINDAKTKVNKQ